MPYAPDEARKAEPDGDRRRQEREPTELKEAPPSEDRPTQRRRSRLLGFLPALLIFGTVSVLVVAHVEAYPFVSPFDEGTHFDYVVEASRGGIVRRGEKLGPEAMREIACRGIDFEGIVEPPCDKPRHDPEKFPLEGFSSAEVHPPLYYAITGILARGLVATGAVEDMFTAARLIGILWLGLGLLVMWHAGRELGIGTAPLAAVTLAMAGTPTLLHASATVTNDTTGLVAGGLLVWVTLRWERGRSPLWLVGAIAFMALAFKATNSLAVAVCVVYLLLRSRRPAGEQAETEAATARNRRVGIAVLVGSMLVSVAAWVVIHGLIATPVVVPIPGAVGELRLLDVVENLTTLITPVSYGLPTDALGTPPYWALGGILGVLVLGATVYPVLRATFSERWERLAGSAGLTMLLGGGAFALVSYFLYGNVTVSARYGLSLIPVLGVALAAAIKWRPALWALAVFAVGQFALVLSALVSA